MKTNRPLNNLQWLRCQKPTNQPNKQTSKQTNKQTNKIKYLGGLEREKEDERGEKDFRNICVNMRDHIQYMSVFIYKNLAACVCVYVCVWMYTLSVYTYVYLPNSSTLYLCISEDMNILKRTNFYQTGLIQR